MRSLQFLYQRGGLSVTTGENREREYRNTGLLDESNHSDEGDLLAEKHPASRKP